MQHYLDAFRHYADFSGRATRSNYWFFILFNMIAAIAIIILETVLGLANPETGFGPIYLLYGIGVMIPSTAIAVRRLHDMGKSGWMMLWSLLPIIGAILVIVWLCTDSASDNKYGPNPKTGASENLSEDSGDFKQEQG
jgi:uncharacterized membrane protein YhaH (DUF805 family)